MVRGTAALGALLLGTLAAAASSPLDPAGDDRRVGAPNSPTSPGAAHLVALLEEDESPRRKLAYVNCTEQVANGAENCTGTDDDDVIFAPNVPDGSTDHILTHGLDGDDIIYGHANADTLYGDAGNDHLLGYGGSDWLTGGAGNDLLEGGDGSDLLLGSAGNDTLNAGDGDDGTEGFPLNGGPGDDVIRGQGGDDFIEDQFGSDILLGGPGDDYIFNYEFGGSATPTGGDIIDGGPGADMIFAANGVQDKIYFSMSEGDTIRSYDMGLDLLYPNQRSIFATTPSPTPEPSPTPTPVPSPTPTPVPSPTPTPVPSPTPTPVPSPTPTPVPSPTPTPVPSPTPTPVPSPTPTPVPSPTPTPVPSPTPTPTPCSDDCSYHSPLFGGPLPCFCGWDGLYSDFLRPTVRHIVRKIVRKIKRWL